MLPLSWWLRVRESMRHKRQEGRAWALVQASSDTASCVALAKLANLSEPPRSIVIVIYVFSCGLHRGEGLCQLKFGPDQSISHVTGFLAILPLRLT